MKILALEPSINLLKLLSDNMQQYGYEFQGALDVELARNALQMGYKPEIIIVNFCFCSHPTISQLEDFVKELNYSYKATIAILDNESETSYLHARGMGFQAIIVKPLNIKNLINEIEFLTGNSNSKSELAFSPSDTRREVRLRTTVEVLLKVFDEQSGEFLQEQTITENISLNGASILTLLDVKVGVMVSLSIAKETESSLAIVKGAFVSSDRIRRLNLQVVGKRWQDFYTELTQNAINKALESQAQLEIDEEEIFNGRYKVEEELGKGGFGIVYLATDLINQKKVAIKLLVETQDMVQHQINQKFFGREIKILSKIQHPNIVSILDSGFSRSGTPFFAMNYIDGISLEQMIKNELIWHPNKVLNLLKQICPALNFIHLKNIIHRDLKPANIMIERETQKAVLLDLGIAKMVRGNSESSLMQQLTKTGMTVGTMQYISPEQCLDTKFDNGVDIYSLGIMVYQLLAGRMPFKTKTLAELIIAHVQGKPFPLTEANPDISQAIESVVLSAIAKERDERPKTTLEFLENFEAAVSQSLNSNSQEIHKTTRVEDQPTALIWPKK